jgi:hypothetical protein
LVWLVDVAPVPVSQTPLVAFTERLAHLRIAVFAEALRRHFSSGRSSMGSLIFSSKLEYRNEFSISLLLIPQVELYP